MHPFDPCPDALLADPRRIVPLFAVHNFRDLGGYPAREGMVTCWRTLYRADALHALTDGDADNVAALGLRTVLDLRTHREVTSHGTFTHQRFDVAFHHVPIIDATWGDMPVPDLDDAVDFLVWAYRDMLRAGAARFAQAIALLASSAALPAVFHCAAGKDRTGMLSALVLGTLGVSDAVIAADYGLSEPAMRRLVAWARQHDPALADLYARIPARFAAADPRAMAVILADLRQEHGSVEGYVRAIGVGDQDVNSLWRQLLTTNAGSPSR